MREIESIMEAGRGVRRKGQTRRKQTRWQCGCAGPHRCGVFCVLTSTMLVSTMMLTAFIPSQQSTLICAHTYSSVYCIA